MRRNFIIFIYQLKSFKLLLLLQIFAAAQLKKEKKKASKQTTHTTSESTSGKTSSRDRGKKQAGSQNFPAVSQRINQTVTFSSITFSISRGRGEGGGLTCWTDRWRDKKMDGRTGSCSSGEAVGLNLSYI